MHVHIAIRFMEEKHFKGCEKKDVTSQQVRSLRNGWSTGEESPHASQAPRVSHFQGKTNELGGPLSWFNTSVLTVFYYPFGMGGLLV